MEMILTKQFNTSVTVPAWMESNGLYDINPPPTADVLLHDILIHEIEPKASKSEAGNNDNPSKKRPDHLIQRNLTDCLCVHR